MSVKLQDNNGSACALLLVTVYVLKHNEEYAYMKHKVSTLGFLILKMEFLFCLEYVNIHQHFGTLLCIFQGLGTTQ
jgi:hypothetical protein